MLIPEPHPAFREAHQMLKGSRTIEDAHDRAAALIEMTGDENGGIATGILATMVLYADDPMSGFVVCYLAGMLRERDRQPEKEKE